MLNPKFFPVFALLFFCPSAGANPDGASDPGERRSEIPREASGGDDASEPSLNPRGGDYAKDFRAGQQAKLLLVKLPKLQGEARENAIQQIQDHIDSMGIASLKFPLVRDFLEVRRRMGTPGSDGAPTPAEPSADPKPGIDKVIPRAAERLQQQYPNVPDGFSLGGQHSVLVQDYERGYKQLNRAIELGARDPDTFASYSAAVLNLGDSRLAAEAAKLALKMKSDHAGAYGVMKLAEGRTPTASLPSPLRGSLDHASDDSTGTGAGQLSQGQLAPLTAAQVATAVQRQLNAEATPVQKSAALTKESATYLRVEDYGAAHAMASKAIELNAQNAQAWTYRAMANNGLQRYEAAVSDASTALKLAPSNAVSLQTRSMSYSLLGKYQDALADANRTIETDPRSGQAYFNRAFALAGLGERDESLESLKKAAEVNPAFQPVYQNALQLPDEADMMLIFKPQSVTVTAAPVSPEAKKKRFARTVITTVSGGLLVTLGLLHILSPRWREGVNATVRRVLGTRNPVAADAAPNATPAPGSGFWSGYTLTREIGVGGMGVVYEATDGALNRRVAIKKMRDEIRVDPTERRRFVAEARTVASLHHHHIVDIYSIVEDDNDVYLVFEYIDGKTLAEALRDKGAFPYEEAKRIMKGVCSAIDYAHRQNVIHRDLKPSNVMLTSEGHVKVMDFGVARQAKEAMTKMSMTNSVVGTPPYMAPEQEQGTVRRESDVFALGICLYELVTGKLPFTGQGAGMLLNKINGKHIPPSQVNPSLPPELDQIVAKALCPDPDKRYRTASELWAALEGQAAVKA